MTPLIEINNLSVEYKTGRAVAKAVNGLNLSIGKGEAIGLVGETGAGKTTTALSILNILPRGVGRITSGDIKLNGESLFAMSEKQLNKIRGKNIAMIFQNPLSSLNPVFTIGDQIAVVIRTHKKISKKEAETEAKSLLRMVGIVEDRYNDYPHQFSGGMRQRVGIAAALACNPDLLIADEPTTALDVTIQAQILSLMKKLQAERNSSLLMITHNFGVVAQLCQRIAVMYAGSIVEIGTIKEVFDRPLHWYTKGLLGAVPQMDDNPDEIHKGKRSKLAQIPGNVANSQMLPKGCKFHPRCTHCTEKCESQMPGLIHAGGEHFVACWNFREEGISKND